MCSLTAGCLHLQLSGLNLRLFAKLQCKFAQVGKVHNKLQAADAG